MGNFTQKLVLVGKLGWKNENVEKLIQENKEKIMVAGFIEDQELISFYQEALCMIYPSFYEGFGIPPLEAMACGCPVILSNTSSLPEVGGKAVLYIDPKKEETILLAMKKIAENEKMRNELSKKGLVQAQKFSWQKSAEKLLMLYKDLDAFSKEGPVSSVSRRTSSLHSRSAAVVRQDPSSPPPLIRDKRNF